MLYHHGIDRPKFFVSSHAGNLLLQLKIPHPHQYEYSLVNHYHAMGPYLRHKHALRVTYLSHILGVWQVAIAECGYSALSYAVGGEHPH